MQTRSAAAAEASAAAAEAIAAEARQADVETLCDLFEHPMGEPVYERDLGAISALVERGVDINGKSAWARTQGRIGGLSPFSLYCSSYSMNYINEFHFLIENGADVQGGNTRLSHPLLFAVHNGAGWVVTQLLKQGARVGRDWPAPGGLAALFGDRYPNWTAIHRMATRADRPPDPCFSHVSGPASLFSVAEAAALILQDSSALMSDEERAERTKIYRIVRTAQLIQRWRRIALPVGRLSLYLKAVYEEVRYRPHNSGAKRCREHFEAACSS